MALVTSGPDAANMRLEPMDLYLGRRNRDCITAAAASTLDAKYFTFSVTTFAGVVTNYYCWFDLDAVSSDPAPAGLTAVEVDVVTGDTAAQVAVLAAAALDAVVGISSRASGDNFIISQWAQGAVTAAVDVDTSFVFTPEAIGESEFLGGTQDAIEMAFDSELVDVTATQTGGILLAQLVSSVTANVTANILEMTAARWNSIIGDVMGSNVTPSGGTEVTGMGKTSIGKNLLSLGKELLMKPTNSTDDLRNLTLFKTAPKPSSINFSGTELQAMACTFDAYLDPTVNNGVNLFAFGDNFQDLELP